MVERFNNIGAGKIIGLDRNFNKPLKADNNQGGDDFKNLLTQSINEVNRLQGEAEQATTSLVTGKNDNVAEVFAAVQKADLAFQALTKIRNTLMDAYDEIKQMKV